ncbi:MAG: AI-2E family transporter [Thermoplasmatota archaeon]
MAEEEALVLPKQSRVFFYLLLGFFLFLSWRIIAPFAIYLVTGTFVAVLALPIDKLWERWVPNTVAALLTMLSLLVIIAIPLVVLGAAMAHDAQALAASVNNGDLDHLADHALDSHIVVGLLERIHGTSNQTLLNATFHRDVASFKVYIQAQLTLFGQEVVAGIPEYFVAITLILFTVYYVLTQDYRLVAYVRRASPLPTWQVDYILHEAKGGLNAVFVGQMVTAIIQGTLGAIGLWATGVPNPVLWGAVMMVLGLMPVVGAFLVWIPAGAWLIVRGHPALGIAELVWGAMVVMILVDNIIRPRLIGSRADIHPMFVLLGVLGGAAAFGFIGLFLGPLLLGVTLSVLKVWEADYMDPRINQLDQDLQRAIPAAHGLEPGERPPA